MKYEVGAKLGVLRQVKSERGNRSEFVLSARGQRTKFTAFTSLSQTDRCDVFT